MPWMHQGASLKAAWAQGLPSLDLSAHRLARAGSNNPPGPQIDQNRQASGLVLPTSRLKSVGGTIDAAMQAVQPLVQLTNRLAAR